MAFPLLAVKGQMPAGVEGHVSHSSHQSHVSGTGGHVSHVSHHSHVSSVPAPAPILAPPVEEPGHRSVNIDINTKKVGQDLHRAEEKVQDALNSSKEDPAKRAATQAINTAKEVGN